MIGLEEAERSFELLDEARDLGCTAFYTAHQYGTGDSERTFGRWMEDRGLREDAVVIGKGAHHNRDRARVTPFDITADLFDFLAFCNLFNAGDPAADCDASGSFDLFDQLCFTNAFNQGC